MIERERKFGAWPGFHLPDLHGLADWVTAGPPDQHVLDAVYWDTPDLRLIRWGITLRHRTTDGTDGRWTLKLPDHGGHQLAGFLARTELEVVAPAGSPPEALTHLVRAYVRTSTLQPVAHLQTVRRSVVLRDRGGRTLAEVADDEVSVLEADRVAARFREVELEIAEGAPVVLGALVADRLRAAGAGDTDPTPKLVRALGPRALAPPEVVAPPLDRDATMGAVAQAAIANAVARLLHHDPVIRLDAGVEGVHQARVSTRRLRSDLRTLGPVVDRDWAEALRADLRELAEDLGLVRDADVLLARLRADAEALGPPDDDAALAVLERLTRARASHLRRLLAVMDDPAYLGLLDRLVQAARAPVLDETLAARPAREVLPELARRPWRKLRRDERSLGPDPAPEALHALRIRAKRARYAAEMAGLVMPAAAAHGKALARVQDALGEYHDAAVAESWLRSAVTSGVSRSQAVAVGLLIARQRAAAAVELARWEKAWKDAAGRRIRAWLEP